MCGIPTAAVARNHWNGVGIANILGFVGKIDGLTGGVGFCKSMQTNGRDVADPAAWREKGGEVGAKVGR